MHIAVGPIFRTVFPYETETLYPLNESFFIISPPPDPSNCHSTCHCPDYGVFRRYGDISGSHNWEGRGNPPGSQFVSAKLGSDYTWKLPGVFRLGNVAYMCVTMDMAWGRWRMRLWRGLFCWGIPWKRIPRNEINFLRKVYNRTWNSGCLSFLRWSPTRESHLFCCFVLTFQGPRLKISWMWILYNWDIDSALAIDTSGIWAGSIPWWHGLSRRRKL